MRRSWPAPSVCRRSTFAARRGRARLRSRGSWPRPSRSDVALRADDAADTGLVVRFWAQQRLAALLLDPEVNRSAIVELGQRYGLVTPHTSLLVLETLDQHLEHGVEPPPSRPEMFHRYRGAIKMEQEQQARRQTDKLDELLAAGLATLARRAGIPATVAPSASSSISFASHARAVSM